MHISGKITFLIGAGAQQVVVVRKYHSQLNRLRIIVKVLASHQGQPVEYSISPSFLHQITWGVIQVEAARARYNYLKAAKLLFDRQHLYKIRVLDREALLRKRDPSFYVGYYGKKRTNETSDRADY